MLSLRILIRNLKSEYYRLRVVARNDSIDIRFYSNLPTTIKYNVFL